jgi:NADH-quinone oxidoreductase subunit C
MNEQPFISQLQSKVHGDQVEFRGETTLHIEREDLILAVLEIREMGFEMLSGIAAVDYLPAEPRFQVTYLFTSLQQHATLYLRVSVPGVQPALDSVVNIYPNANWREREIFDMFGINFTGHPDMRRILMPFDWEGHPLRKDYPLGYEEPQFSFNFDEIQIRKPNAGEQPS